jgi:hypothetical protein
VAKPHCSCATRACLKQRNIGTQITERYLNTKLQIGVTSNRWCAELIGLVSPRIAAPLHATKNGICSNAILISDSADAAANVPQPGNPRAFNPTNKWNIIESFS